MLRTSMLASPETTVPSTRLGLQVGLGEGHREDAAGDLQHTPGLDDGEGHAAG